MKLIYPAISYDHTNPLRNKELIGNYLVNTFKKYGVEIEFATTPTPLTRYLLYFYREFYQLIFHKKYLLDRAIPILKSTSRNISKKIAKSDADFIFAFGTVPIAFIETNKPIYLITDATYHLGHNSYPIFSNVSKRSDKNAELVENLAFNKARKIFLSSNWVIRDAFTYYHVPKSKLVHTYLGANIPSSPSLEEVEKFIKNRNNENINLILIGKNWKLKGADRAIAINNELIERGYKSNLTVIGCTPPDGAKLSNSVKVIPMLDKSKLSELEQFQKYLSESHFMLFPTLYDSFGHVVCEASAYGVPTIAANTGGVSEAVKDGVNGFLFDFNDDNTIQKATDIIIYYFNNPIEYKQLCLSSFERFQNELNWDVIVSKMLDVIKEDIAITV